MREVSKRVGLLSPLLTPDEDEPQGGTGVAELFGALREKQPELIIPYRDLHLEHHYFAGGENGSARVYKGKFGRVFVAAKKILCEVDVSVTVEAERELRFLSKIRHQHIVDFLGVSYHDDR
jgi:hypothetical protein